MFNPILVPNLPSNSTTSVALFIIASEKSVFEEFAKIFIYFGVFSKFCGFESIKILVTLTIPENFI